MNKRTWAILGMIALLSVLVPALLEAAAQEPGPQEPKQGDKKGPPFGMKGKGPGGFGFGGMGGPKRLLVKQFDKNGDGWLNAEERKAARAFLRTQGGPGGFGPGGKGFGGKGKGPGGFGPGNFLSKPLLEALDTDKDGKLSKDELLAGVKTFFTDSDKDKKGTLSQDELATNLNRIFPRPPGFPGGGGPKGPPGGGPGGPPGGFGPGNFLAGAMFQRADANKDGKLTLKELVTAAEALFKEVDKNKAGKLDEQEIAAGINLLFPAPKGFGGFGKGNRDPARPGPRVAPADVTNYPKASLYEPTVLRTLFLEFENADWEAELADFRSTDVEVPCTLTVDGKKYRNVGVHFRGMSSYFMVPAGHKRSLNLSLDLADKKQRLYGYKTLNLLNGADDPTFLHTVLFAHVARQYTPSPKSNLIKVVINGESWGVYANYQQFNKDFLADNYNTRKGARWKVRGNPGADGGLNYVGDNVEEYKRRYTIKSKDDPKDWKALIDLCRTLSQTPLDKLEAALKPILDIEGVLWFLALDNATINEDGYWVRGSDYSLYRDPKGKFHVIAQDTNETFMPLMGFGFGKGPPGGGFGKGPKGGGGFGKGPKGEGGFGKGPKEGGGFGKGPKGGPGGGPGAASYALDPLIGLDNTRRPLRSRLLAVPSLRARYLEHMRTIAEAFDWNTLRPLVAQYRALIEKEVELDTRKLYTLAEFKSALADVAPTPGQGSRFNLRAFAEGRRNYLLNYPAIRDLGRQPGGSTNKGSGD